MPISRNFEGFQYFNLDTNFLKLEYLFLVESTKTENAIFPYKTAVSKTNVRQIEWGVQYGLISKNRVLLVTTFVFRKFCFSLRTLYKELIRCRKQPNVHVYTFRKRWSFI